MNRIGFFRFRDAATRRNAVLMSGLVIAPVAAGATDFISASLIALAFSCVTFFGVLLCRLIPRSVVYTVRIVFYALIAGAVYFCVYMLLPLLFAQRYIDGVGVYLPILICNPVILSKMESRFSDRSVSLKVVAAEAAGYIVGFDVVCLVVGAVRDVLVNGSIGWVSLPIPPAVPALETTFGGLFIVGVFAALFRKVIGWNK